MLKSPAGVRTGQVEVPLIDLTAQLATIRDAVDEAITRVVESQRFVLGRPVEELEERIADLVGVGHAVGCASGTDALLLPLRLLGEGGAGDVVVPAFTFFATAGAVHNAGLRPVFCDVSEDTFNVTAETVDEAWTTDTVGVIPVHLFGQMAPVEEITARARERGAWVLEDAAQAIGTVREHGGRTLRAGGVGDAGAFSFFPTKNLGAFGEGGIVTTDDASLAGRLREYRIHGGIQMYRHDVVGTNSRLHTLQAAVLLAKLPWLEQWNEARARNAQRYLDGLAGLPDVVLPTTLPGNRHIYNQFTLRVTNRDGLRRHLDEHGVGSGVYYPVPLHLQPCFRDRGHREGDFPVSERLSETVLSLPIFPELTGEQIDTVIHRIREFHGAA